MPLNVKFLVYTIFFKQFDRIYSPDTVHCAPDLNITPHKRNPAILIKNESLVLRNDTSCEKTPFIDIYMQIILAQTEIHCSKMIIP